MKWIEGTVDDRRKLSVDGRFKKLRRQTEEGNRAEVIRQRRVKIAFFKNRNDNSMFIRKKCTMKK